MPKDAFWFPHDSNARTDPAICKMRARYKTEGYGWYWMLIEMMREQSDYMLTHSDIDGYALQTQCASSKLQAFVTDCEAAFHLFETDGERFWSRRLMREMQYKAEKSQQARIAAKVMHEKRQSCERIASAEQPQSTSMLKHNITEQDNTVQNKENDSSVEESMNVKPKKPTGFTPPTVDEVVAYCRERGNGIDATHWCDFYESKAWMIGKNKMKDWKAAVRTWERNSRSGGEQSTVHFDNEHKYAASEVKSAGVFNLEEL